MWEIKIGSDLALELVSRANKHRFEDGSFRNGKFEAGLHQPGRPILRPGQTMSVLRIAMPPVHGQHPTSNLDATDTVNMLAPRWP